MSRLGAALVAMACVVAVVLWWRFGEDRVRPADAGGHHSSSVAAAGHTGAAGPTQDPAPSQSQDSPRSVERADYDAHFRAAPDYLEFTRSLLPAARAGDHAAQFHVFRALEYCATEYRAFFGRGPAWRTLDDAMRRAATRWPYNSEIVRKVHAQCHELMEGDAQEFGERSEWLRMASDGGHPLAQATYAQSQWRASPGADDDVTLDARRRLVGKAIRSRDPAVVSAVADVVLTRVGEGYQWDHLGWRLAACQRGFDCSAQSDFVKWTCYVDTNCQPYETAVDLIRRATGNDFPDVEARARWINEKIDAGDWEALGF
jgi:hypothetical protein